MVETHPYIDPVAYLERRGDAFQSAVNAILRHEVNWLYNGRWSAGIVAADNERPVCVILRRRDAQRGIDASTCWLPEELGWAVPGFNENRDDEDCRQLVSDVTEVVSVALEETA